MMDYLKFWLSKQLVELGICAGVVILGVLFLTICKLITKERKSKKDDK